MPQLGLTQETISKRGFAIQCRITTEDAAQGFAPDTGKIEVYRSAGGNGVRLDASSGFAGAQVTVSHTLIADMIVHGTDKNRSSLITILSSSNVPHVVLLLKSPEEKC